MILVVGASGNLGYEITQQFANLEKIECFPRELIGNFSREHLRFSDESYLESLRGLRLVIIAAGIIDNDYPYAEHLKLNYYLPRNFLNAGKRLGFKTLTFGSIHEYSDIKSNYLQSKKLLRDFLSNDPNLDFLHFQLNTLYSTYRIHPKSFLGQLRNALTNKKEFKMSSGMQLRQFHNTRNIVEKVVDIASQEDSKSMFLPICSNQVLSLGETARFFFSQTNQLDLLQTHNLPDPENEIYSHDFFNPFAVNLDSDEHPLLSIYSSLMR